MGPKTHELGLAPATQSTRSSSAASTKSPAWDRILLGLLFSPVLQGRAAPLRLRPRQASTRRGEPFRSGRHVHCRYCLAVYPSRFWPPVAMAALFRCNKSARLWSIVPRSVQLGVGLPTGIGIRSRSSRRCANHVSRQTGSWLNSSPSSCSDVGYLARRHPAASTFGRSGRARRMSVLMNLLAACGVKESTACRRRRPARSRSASTPRPLERTPSPSAPASRRRWRIRARSAPSATVVNQMAFTGRLTMGLLQTAERMARWYYGALADCFANIMPGRLSDRLSRVSPFGS